MTNTNYMNRSDTLPVLNVVGSLCSIIALLLTLSGNFALRNITQIVFGVIAVVGVGGVVYEIARSCWKSYINIDLWAIKLLYRLFVLIVGAVLSVSAGIGVFCITDLLLEMGNSALKLIFQ